MTPVQSDKRLFTDSQGAPLDGGYVYVGQPSKAPQVPANQVTVTFKDDAGNEFTASQPLRTVGGKIVYNGSPIATFVDGEHSLLVLNSAGVQVEYSASISPVESTGGGGTASDTIQVGLTLADVKALPVAVGDVARSVGQITATDDLGADWLVISSTGNPGDDGNLIDFDNGLQGVRYRAGGTVILDRPIAVLDVTGITAEAYNSTWTEVDISSAVPAGAISAIIGIDAYIQDSTSPATLTINSYARKTGSGLAFSVSDRTLTKGIGGVQLNTAIDSSVCRTDFHIALDKADTPKFDFAIWFPVGFDSTVGTSAIGVYLAVIGYTI